MPASPWDAPRGPARRPASAVWAGGLVPREGLREGCGLLGGALSRQPPTSCLSSKRRGPSSAPSRTAISLPRKTRQEVSSFQKGQDKKCASETTDYYPFAYENSQFVPIRPASAVCLLRHFAFALLFGGEGPPESLEGPGAGGRLCAQWDC